MRYGQKSAEERRAGDLQTEWSLMERLGITLKTCKETLYKP